VPKKSRRDIFQRIFSLGIIWSEVSHYAATPLIAVLSLGHCDMTRSLAWSRIATGNNLDRAEKITYFDHNTGTVDAFDPGSDISGPTSRRGSACRNLNEYWAQLPQVGCPVAQLLI